jgi:hypothetical protein
MNDIVIDTNVLLHTSNKGNQYYESANKTLVLVLQKDLSICVDDIFDVNEAKNTSVIGSEYHGKVIPGTFAYAFLLDRFIKGKYVQIIKKNYKNVKLDLIKKIKNRHDIAFVIAAYGSQDKILVSNDFEDFTSAIRKYVSKKFQISILDSEEYSLAS